MNGDKLTSHIVRVLRALIDETDNRTVLLPRPIVNTINGLNYNEDFIEIEGNTVLQYLSDMME